jgi:hypothetical protein
MSKTLHQFGRVLFDELEQLAVRRGGFASLTWVNEKLREAQRGVEELGKKAADPNVDVSSGCYLRLMSTVREVSDVPTGGKDLIVVDAADNVLHFRITDGDGKVVVETDEQRLTKQDEQIEKLRKRLESLWPAYELTAGEKGHVITAVTSIVGHAPPSLRERADKCAKEARDALALAARTAEAVDQLGQIMRDMVKMAQDVLNKIQPPDQASVGVPPQIAWRLLRAILDKVPPPRRHLIAPFVPVRLLRAMLGEVPSPTNPEEWHASMEAVKLKLAHLDKTLHNSQQKLSVQKIRNQKRERIHEARYQRACRVAWGQNDPEKLYGDDKLAWEGVIRALHRKTGNTFDNQGFYARVIRGAVVRRSRDLASELRRAVGRFARVIPAFREMANAKQDAVVELEGLVAAQIAEQSGASLYEIYGVVEDAARRSAIRMGTVGLAFSGGGIRSATFNLGFLQGAAALGLLKQFDYLSTVSGGGYSGAWFAAWVLREGGRQPKPPTNDDFKRELAKLSADEEEKTARAWLAAWLRPERRRAGDPEPPTDVDVKGELASPGANAAKRINDEARKPREPAGDRRTTEASPKDKKEEEAQENVEKRYNAEVVEKRRRTSQALENVQKQLSSSRARQAQAVRCWASPATIREGREATVRPALSKHPVEEEPEPVHHLREHSNYLAPKIGLLSIDPWTIVSVYLRNLFLNQFILLSMMLAVIAFPRLLLLLFTHSTSLSMLTLARGWLDRYDGWPVLAVFFLAFAAIVTAPKLVDSFAWRLVTRLHGLTILAFVAVGMMALVFVFTIQIFPSLVASSSRGMVRTLVRCEFLILFLLALAAVIGRRHVVRLAGWVSRGPYKRIWGWGILSILVLGTAALVRMLPPLVLFLAERFFWPLTGDGVLFLLTFVMAWLGFHWTYQTVAQIPKSRRLASAVQDDHRARSDVTEPIGWRKTVVALTLVSCGVSLLFARPKRPFFVFPLPKLSDLFHPATANWGGMEFWPAVVCFGVLVGFMRCSSSLIVSLTDRSRQWKLTERLGRAYSALWSGLISGAGLAAVLSWLRGLGAALPGGPGAVIMSFGPALVMVAIGAGSALEVGLIGGYTEENLREWRASLGANLLKRGALWTALCVLSIYCPFFFWWGGSWAAWAAGTAWVVTVFLGALAGRSERTDGVKTGKSPLEYIAVIAPPVFIIGLVVAVSVLAAALQGVPLTVTAEVAGADQHFLHRLSYAGAERTWMVMLVSACLAMVACVHLNINLFGLNAFYANRLVRCYLGASRPREAPKEGRPNFAPTNSPGPVRQPNLITGFDLNDDFPMRDLAIVSTWRGCDLQLMTSLENVSHVPKTGRDLIIVADLGNVLHFRMFGSDGRVVVRTDEKKLMEQAQQVGEKRLAEQAARIVALRTQLEGLWPPQRLTANEKRQVITAVTAIVDRTCGFDDLVTDYRGPYHLINTAMNLVAGSELAWQERMAESFILSPLYCGSKTTGYRRANIVRSDLEDDEVKLAEVGSEDSSEVPGYGDNVRLGTAISVSGAAASPNAGYHSSPLVTFLMTILNARLGLWFGHPARAKWRRSGPEFAFYLLGELFGLTTNKGKYVYLSDGGHFENLGAYELVRRRCRYIVVCDAGADPGLSFWDLGSLVRKCRQDFGIRIEIDTSPLMKKEGTPFAKWHCAVGQIHYDEVDVGALPGTLLYIKPSLSGDEPSDVCNYVVEHPSFPHESTANQFFSESQFESYRELGEHIARNVFSDAASDAGPDSSAATLFFQLHRRWAQAPPTLDKDYLESVKPCLKIHEALRTDSKLEGLSRELYPKGGQPTSDAARTASASPPGDDRAAVHAVIEMVQAMENAWIALNLDAYSDHPLNRGWMNAFRRWISSEIFRTHWPAVRGEFSEGFVRFCESELNLTVQEPNVKWLEVQGAPDKKGRTMPLLGFLKGVQELDKEFSLEWPHIVLHEIGDGRSGLAEMFRHARKHPPVLEKWPMAVLIQPGETALDGRPTSEPSYYGVILAWGASDGVVDLVVWLRGAYRTLGLGGAVEKTLSEFKDELKTLKPNGYTLRTRYPSDARSKGKQRWQRTLWTDLFQNQGFHREGSDPHGDDQDTLIYRYEPR